MGDLWAVANPAANRRFLVIFGVLATWAQIGLVASAIASRWSVAGILLATGIVSGLLWYATVRAQRRAPKTMAGLEQFPDER